MSDGDKEEKSTYQYIKCYRC